uniref:Uncharacterized protein n=1 Tax=Anopheles epiroticus TaxID=199890 RepID=A0A182PHZ9_9DIPT
MDKLKAENEELRQELYVVRNKLQVANKTTTDLSDELELMVAKSAQEMDRIRTQYANQLKAQETLIEKLSKEIEERPELPVSQPLVPEPDHVKETLRILQEKSLRAKRDWENEEQQYQADIKLLEQKLTTADRELSTAVCKISELNEEVEALQEKFASKKANLLIKTQEAEELRELLEAAQQQNGMLSAELAGLRSDSNNPREKGNSLFGEVADQRKKLLNTLSQMKTRYFQLKSEHEDCPRRIRELRNMHQECQRQYEQCMKMIRSAEYYNVMTLHEQNKDLNDQVDRASRRIRYLENELATGSADWVNKLITYYKNETQKLETSLRSYQFKQREAMELHQNAVKDAWKWQLEAQRLKMKVMNIEVPSSTPTLPENEEQSPPDTTLIADNVEPSLPDAKVSAGNAPLESEKENQDHHEKDSVETMASAHLHPPVTVSPCKSKSPGKDVAGAPLQEKSQKRETDFVRPKLMPLKCYKISDLIAMRAAQTNEKHPDVTKAVDGVEEAKRET